MFNLKPGHTIGIIGGGQLGRMMTLSAKYKGYRVGVLDPTPDCPTAQVADFQIIGAYDNVTKLEELASKVDVITYEFENVDVDAINQIKEIVPVPQGTDLLAVSQDRLLEKTFLEEQGIVIAPYATIIHPSDVSIALDEVGYPAVLKTTRGGYDGKGQHVIYSQSDIAPALNLLRESTCVLESMIAFEKEISVIISGNGQGDYTTFPVSENLHRNNILFETIAPARIDCEIAEEAKRIATQIAKGLNLAGTLCVEMFLTEEGAIYVNEIAPRPHNSGHYSIESCSQSQFDTHIKGICGLKLGEVVMLKPAIMVNILGDEYAETLDLIEEKPDWSFHYYGKDEVKRGRKMGHVTILTKNLADTLEEIYETKVWE
ncbi:MAG: 5-(carboxyamino)imidazole ribonucleotide synthase [Streptococcaceae bacterium]|nr:5-(carboxyamino)imidazole ribonucleotide synthase [Streptococcaceae bacterium]